MSEIVNKENIPDYIKSNERLLRKNVLSQINNNLQKNKNIDYYFLLVKINKLKYDQKVVIDVIKSRLFNTDLIFKIKTKKWMSDNVKLYMKILNKCYYRITTKEKFNRILQEGIKKEDKIIYMKKYIDKKNLLLCYCSIRNYNMLLSEHGYNFDGRLMEYNTIGHDQTKYFVYTKIQLID